jgi:branched-chain amino acid transport system ATP-binding protein
LGRNCAVFVCIEKGQVVVAAGLEQSARSQMVLRLAILAGEPASGPRGAMGEAGHGRIGSLLAEIVRRGVAISLIEQKLAIALKITHRLYVIADRTVNGNVDIDILARQCDPG